MTKKSPARKVRDAAQKLQGDPQATIRNLQVQLMMSEQRLRTEATSMAATRDQFLIWMSILIDKLGGKSVLITDKQYKKAQEIWAGLDTNRLKTGMKFTLVTIEEVAENAEQQEAEVPNVEE